jgi:phosphatidyl-myo-inositol dimannoside synthase
MLSVRYNHWQMQFRVRRSERIQSGSKRQMKSLLISGTYFPPQVGGISRYMACVAKCLSPEEVCCFTGVRSNDNQQESGDEEKKLSARIYRRPRAFAGKSSLQGAALGASIAEILVRERPQVVQLATAAEGYVALQLQRWVGLPYVVYAHGNEILDAINSTWDKPKLSLRRAARVLANSQFTADLVAKAGVEPQRILILHPGCDVEWYQPREVSADSRLRMLREQANARVILSVGNLVQRKGHDMVIRALRAVLKDVPDALYLIAGDGPYRSELESIAMQAGVGDRVIFAGSIPEKQLPEVYGLADVFVLPSRMRLESYDVEGFGMVFLEANACGKPVIGGRCGGIPDAIVEGTTGFLVDPLDPGEIADNIVRLLDNPELGRRMGLEGRQRVVREFTWDHFAGRLRAILNSMISDGDGREAP